MIKKKRNKTLVYALIGSGITILSLLIFVLIPNIINYAYRVPQGLPKNIEYSYLDDHEHITGRAKVTMWGATDFLIYSGSAFAFVGTVFLGYVAIEQTRSNTKLLKNQTDARRSIFSPVTTQKRGNLIHYEVIVGENEKYIELNFKNVGPDHVLLNEEGYHRIQPVNHIISSKKKLKIYDDKSEKKYIEFSFSLRSIYGVDYIQHFQLYIEHVENPSEEYIEIIDFRTYIL